MQAQTNASSIGFKLVKQLNKRIRFSWAILNPADVPNHPLTSEFWAHDHRVERRLDASGHSLHGCL